MRRLIITIEDNDGETITRCEKSFTETDYKSHSWSWWKEVLYGVVQDLEQEVDKVIAKGNE